jgi:hypothetical protein
LKLPKALRAAADFFKGPVNMEQRLLDRIISDLFCRNIRSADSFYRHAEDVSPILISRGQGLLDRCLPVLKAYHNARKEFDKLKRANLNNHAVQNFCKDLITDPPDSLYQVYGNPGPAGPGGFRKRSGQGQRY